MKLIKSPYLNILILSVVLSFSMSSQANELKKTSSDTFSTSKESNTKDTKDSKISHLIYEMSSLKNGINLVGDMTPKYYMHMIGEDMYGKFSVDYSEDTIYVISNSPFYQGSFIKDNVDLIYVFNNPELDYSLTIKNYYSFNHSSYTNIAVFNGDSLIITPYKV